MVANGPSAGCSAFVRRHHHTVPTVNTTANATNPLAANRIALAFFGSVISAASTIPSLA